MLDPQSEEKRGVSIWVRFLASGGFAGSLAEVLSEVRTSQSRLKCQRAEWAEALFITLTDKTWSRRASRSEQPWFQPSQLHLLASLLLHPLTHFTAFLFSNVLLRLTPSRIFFLSSFLFHVFVFHSLWHLYRYLKYFSQMLMSFRSRVAVVVSFCSSVIYGCASSWARFVTIEH